MEMTFAQCETILKTLPIGYYAGRRISTTLDAKEETSFYSPMEDKIVVSYPIIALRAAQMADTTDPEEAVRTMLYHEVSHAILTPQQLRPDEAINCFEDERIETLLQDYYMGVDFKKQLYDIYGGKIPTPHDGMSAFYNAVRFRCAPKPILKDIESMIKKYKTVNRTTDYYSCCDYAREIKDLYKKITKEYHKDPSQFKPDKGTEKDDKSQQGNSESRQGNSKPQQGTKDKAQQGKPKSAKGGCAFSEEEMKDIAAKALSQTTGLSGEQAQQLNDFTKTAEMIISNFNKKNNGGSGINAYSGVFNPRSVARNDYRYFDRAMTTQGNNKFGTCHLNLFIDCSGSMHWNEKIVNGMLASLSEIESKNRNFSISVSFINDKYHDCTTVRERNFRARGGNQIPKDMKSRFLKRQLPNTCNYNIVLFDGDCFTDDWDSSDAQKRALFGAFDYKQTTLITDPENKAYLPEGGFRSTKVVVTENYADELLNHVIKALAIAFG